MTPRFVTFEGGEGAGKSTQIKLLAQSFTNAAFAVDVTREPGGSQGGEIIRKLVVEAGAHQWNAATEALLFMAARYDHLHARILPALASGQWVLCDRFYDSTYVYQGMAKQVGTQWLNQLYSLLYGNIAPDLTILLDIEPEIGLQRAKSRSGNETRFENLDTAFHHIVRQGFLDRAASEPSRFHVVSAAQDIHRIHIAIVAHVNARFGLALTPSQSGAV